MKSKAQRYCLMFHSRATEAIAAEEKYTHFFSAIQDLPSPWRLENWSPTSAPDFGRSSSATVSLTKLFGGGVRRALMTFEFRRCLEDKSSSDDRLIIDFDPARVDLHQLVYIAIPKYVEAFDAYVVDYFDEQLRESYCESRDEEGRITFTPKSRDPVNRRFVVEEVHLVSFYDELLCRRAFSLPPSEVVERLQGTVEHARVLHQGAYIVGSSKVLPVGDAQRLTRDMTAILRASRS